MNMVLILADLKIILLRWASLLFCSKRNRAARTSIFFSVIGAQRLLSGKSCMSGPLPWATQKLRSFPSRTFWLVKMTQATGSICLTSTTLAQIAMPFSIKNRWTSWDSWISPTHDKSPLRTLKRLKWSRRKKCREPRHVLRSFTLRVSLRFGTMPCIILLCTVTESSVTTGKRSWKR